MLIHASNKILLILTGTLLFLSADEGLFAQIKSVNNTERPDTTINHHIVDSTHYKIEPQYLTLRPWIGLGVGNLSMFGDVASKSVESPLVSRIAYDLSLSQDLNKWLSLRFYFMAGKIGVNGTYDKRMYNLQSQIYAGGMQFRYNFHQLLNPNRYMEPYLLLGIEGFEFLSKSDEKDTYGNTYYYWSDGSIRNIDENSPEKYKAKKINKDYIYESDLRQQNIDGFGKYSEYAFAVPVGGGMSFLLHEKARFNLGATMHFTTTDLIDNISYNGTGIRQGNKANDNYLLLNASFQYNLTPKKEHEILENDAYINDLIAAGDEDQDGDGVIDFVDSSAFTPKGVFVNSKGIPYDNDRDNIPNYRDLEAHTDSNIIVDENGVALNDSAIAAYYDFYTDSTGKYGKMEVLKSIDALSDGGGLFKVVLGNYKTGVPSELINKFLSLKDINSFTQPDSSTTYTSGAFVEYGEAKARLETVKNLGITDASIIVHKEGQMIPVDDNNYTQFEPKQHFTFTNVAGENISSGNDSSSKVKPVTTQAQDNVSVNSNDSKESSTAGEGQVIYRVQLGAYKRKVSQAVFGSNKNLVSITGNDGVTRYLSGNYSDYADAAKHKIEMVTKGFGGAFVVAFKGGKRVTLESTGVQFVRKTKEDTLAIEKSAVTKKLVVFKVQLGVYKNEPPKEMKKIFDNLKQVEESTTTTGLKRYTLGSFNDYKKAQEIRAQVINLGVKDAFVIAFFDDKLIDVQEALELLK